MDKGFRYYVHKIDGKVTRLARIGGGKTHFGSYGWEDGKWVYMPGLSKIENDITDYEKITAEEALEIMEG